MEGARNPDHRSEDHVEFVHYQTRLAGFFATRNSGAIALAGAARAPVGGQLRREDRAYHPA